LGLVWFGGKHFKTEAKIIRAFWGGVGLVVVAYIMFVFSRDSSSSNHSLHQGDSPCIWAPSPDIDMKEETWTVTWDSTEGRRRRRRREKITFMFLCMGCWSWS